jgi:hypothetical protein
MPGVACSRWRRRRWRRVVTSREIRYGGGHGCVSSMRILAGTWWSVAADQPDTPVWVMYRDSTDDDPTRMVYRTSKR